MLARLALVLTVEVVDPTGIREAAGLVEVAREDRKDTKSPVTKISRQDCLDTLASQWTQA